MKLLLSILFLFVIFEGKGQSTDSEIEAERIYQEVISKKMSSDSSKLLLEKALTLLPQKNKSDKIAYLYSSILYEKSCLEYSQSNYQEAITDGLTVEKIIKEVENNSKKESKNTSKNTQQNREDSEKRQRLLQKNYYQLANSYSKISTLVNLKDEDYTQKSSIYYNTALQTAYNLADTSLILQTICGIANVFINQKKYDSAEYYSHKIINQMNDFSKNNTETENKNLDRDNKVFGMAYNYLGIIYYNKADFEKAETYFSKSVYHSQQVKKNTLTLLSAMGNLANVYMEQKRYNLATAKLNELIELNKESKRLQNISKNYITLYNSYKRQNKLDSALFAYENYILYKDSILNETHLKAIKNLELKYETQKKEKEINDLQLKNALREADLRQKNVWIISIVSLAILVLGGVLFYYRQRNTVQKQQQAESKQQLLAAQMNPHFLFNALNSVQRLYVEGKMTEANRFMSEFAHFIRAILDKTARTRIPLGEEVDFLQAYLELEKKRLGDKFDYSIEIDEELKNSFFEVPSLISQPLVENALIHGIIPRLNELDKVNSDFEKGLIEINVVLDKDETIIFTIKDNGIGYQNSLATKQKNNSHISKGMNLIHSRLGKKGKLVIDSENQNRGTIVKIYIPT